MKLPLVSIIVPCYNVETFLDKGLTSISNQIYTNWECLLINDGSTDSSEGILQTWTKKDPRFKLISQQNKGLSGARNTGLEHANGDFVYFFDPDDLLAKNCLENLVPLFNNDVDIVIGKNAKVVNQTTEVIAPLKHGELVCRNIENKSNQLLKLALKTPFSVVAWNKLYSHQFIKKHTLKFENGIVHEDELWFFEVLFFAKGIIFNDAITYFYNTGNANSITKNYKLRNLTSYIAVLNKMYFTYYKEINDIDKRNLIASYIIDLQITVSSGFYRFLRKNSNPELERQGTALLQAHLEKTEIDGFYEVSKAKNKDYEFFLKYGKKDPKLAFNYIRYSRSKSLIKKIQKAFIKLRL